MFYEYQHFRKILLRISCIHIICFDQICSLFSFLLPSLPITLHPKSVSSYFFKPIEPTFWYMNVHVCRIINWSTGSFSGAATRKKTDPPLSSHYLPTTILVGVRLGDPLPKPCWNLRWLNLLQAFAHRYGKADLVKTSFTANVVLHLPPTEQVSYFHSFFQFDS